MNKTTIYLIIFLIIGSRHLACGQIKTNVSFSHAYFDQAKSINKTRKEYRRFLRDSLRNIRRLNRQFDFKMDSLIKVLEKESELQTRNPFFSIDSLSNTSQKSREQFKTLGIDSSSYDYLRNRDTLIYSEPWARKDSLFQSQQNETLDKLEAEILEQVGIFPSGSMPTLPNSGNPLQAPKPDFNRFRAGKTLKNNLDKLPQTHLDKFNSSLNDGHQKMNSMKKKYTSLPSLDDLEGGLKINSLKSQPMNKRIKVGGNLTIGQQENSVNMDFSPSVAYRWTKKMSTGIEGMYRTQFGGGRSLGNSFFTADTYGGRVFNDHILLKSIYAHVEFESLITQVTSIQDNSTLSEIVLGAMAGFGNSFTLSKSLLGKINIQYNFLHNDSNPVYSSPWVIRFGIEFKKNKK